MRRVGKYWGRISSDWGKPPMRSLQAGCGKDAIFSAMGSLPRWKSVPTSCPKTMRPERATSEK